MRNWGRTCIPEGQDYNQQVETAEKKVLDRLEEEFPAYKTYPALEQFAFCS